MSTTITVIVTALVIGGLSFVMSRTKPEISEDGRQSIRMPRALIMVMGVLSGLMGLAGAALAIYSIANGNMVDTIPGVILAAMFLPITALSFAGLNDAYVVSWDDEGVTGPSTLYTSRISEKRISIPWSEMTKLGETSLQTIYVEGEDGRRICWSQYYSGHTALEDRVRAAIEARLL